MGREAGCSRPIATDVLCIELRPCLPPPAARFSAVPLHALVSAYMGACAYARLLVSSRLCPDLFLGVVGINEKLVA